MRRWLPLAAAIAVSLVLVTGYRVAGGGSYAPKRPASPCLPHHWAPVSSLDAAGPLLENLRLALAAEHLSAVPVGRLMRDAGTTT